MTRHVHSLLLVDDNPIVLRGWRSQLRARTVEVFTATDRASSVAHVEQRSIDVAIVDQRLGSERGSDVISDILAVQPAIRAVLTSAELTVRDIAEAGRLGVEFFEKPDKIVDLVDLVESGAELPTPELIPMHHSIDMVVHFQILRVLKSKNNNLSEAAETLGLSRRGLQKKLRKRGIAPREREAIRVLRSR